MTLPLLLKIPQPDSMLELKISNILPLRAEVTENLHKITVDEDEIEYQLSLPVPNQSIINACIENIERLEIRNAEILQFLENYTG